ncbi:hypothetical protein P9029_30760, partial [Bacillus thuringiensis]|nr:hypothetical protein [Bacillus thuringiensis]
MSWNNDIFSDFLTLIFLAWFFSEMLAVPHAHQLKDMHYPQVSKNVILSKKLARKDDIFYESFNSSLFTT